MSSAVLHISDPHFGTEQPHVVAALTRLAHALAPQLLIVSGDLTQRARTREFEAARRFIDALQVPHTLSVPGNHDIPLLPLHLRCFAPYGRWSRCIGSDLEPAFESDRMLVQCVNTTRWYRHKHGQIADAQIARVGTRLARATPAQLRVVVAHHPVLAIRPRDAHNLLRRHERAAAAFSSAGCDLVLGGHIHLPYIRPLHVEASQLSHRTWVVQAGTAVSRRTREGTANSVNVLCLDANAHARCVVERWDFDARAGDFVRVHAESLALTRPGMGLTKRTRSATTAIGSDG